MSFIDVLGQDLRQLSQDARKSEGIASQFTGWLQGTDNQEIKEAAEQAMLKLRAFAREENCNEQICKSKEVLAPFLLSCSSRSAKLCALALTYMQKLLANVDLDEEGRKEVIQGLLDAEKGINDQGIKLKLLQTALTLLQSSQYADDVDGKQKLLSLCMRMCAGANQRQGDTVFSTGLATIRQAVALMFGQVATLLDSDTQEDIDVQKVDEMGRSTVAANLLSDLCKMGTGVSPAWIQSPPIQRKIILDLITYSLQNSPIVYYSLQRFQEVLREGVCHVLDVVLGWSFVPHQEPPYFIPLVEVKAAVTCAHETIRFFHGIVPSKVDSFAQHFLRGSLPTNPTWHRVFALQTLRKWCGAPGLLYFLYSTFDMKMDYESHPVQELIAQMSMMVEGYGQSVGDESEESLESLAILGSLYAQKTSGKEWTPDSEHFNSIPKGREYVVMLSLDCLLYFVRSLERLTDTAVAEVNARESESHPSHEPLYGTTLTSPVHKFIPRSEVLPQVCTSMAELSWEKVLRPLGRLLAASQGEGLILELLKCYQSFAQALGTLNMLRGRDAYLKSLCQFTTPKPDPNQGGAIILQPKNVQALRTLFNVVHRLDNVLGDSWILVLENLDTLDRVLDQPSTTTQEISPMPVYRSFSSDLKILEVAADQLFESTSRMTKLAVRHVMLALVRISIRSIPKDGDGDAIQPQIPSDPNGKPKLYAMSRMVDTLLNNVHRIEEFWPVFYDHVTEVIDMGRTNITEAAIDCLDRAVIGLLKLSYENEKDNKRVVYSMSEGEYRLEEHLMATIEQIYTKGNEPSVCIGSLKMVLHVLQRHGEHLRTGWAPMLRLLRQVPRRHQDSKMQALAFQSMELVCRDYLDQVTPELLPTVLEVVALYAKHSRDMNLSLTAVNLLWHAADLFGRQMGLARSQNEQGGQQQQAAAYTIPLDQSVALLQSVLELLRDVSLDNRTVIRNSGVETLFKVVNTQGAQMPLELWVKFMEEVLLPLLQQVYQKSRTASSEEMEVLEVGDDGDGRQIKGMMHHSMNTAQKQWDQTLKRALLGLTGTLCKYIPILSSWVKWPTAWEQLIQISEHCLSGERKDVTMQAINLLCSVLRTYHNQPNLLTQIFWKRALQAINEGVITNTVWKCETHTAAREEIVKEIFGQDEGLYAVTKRRFDLEDHRLIFSWIDRFGRCAYTILVPPPKTSVSYLPQVQKTVNAFFSQEHTPLPPLPVEEAWPDLIQVICGFLRPQEFSEEQDDHQKNEQQSKLESQQDQQLVLNGLSDLWIEEMIRVLVLLYRDYMPWRYQCITLPYVVEALGRCMQLRVMQRDRVIWRSAAKAFNEIINQGVPAISRSILEGKQPPEEVWPKLAQTLQSFFFYPLTQETDNEQFVNLQKSQLQSYNSAALNQDAELVTSVLDSLCDSIMTICLHAPSKIRAHFVDLLDEGVSRGYKYHEPETMSQRFSHVCLRKMFVLCSRGSSNALISHNSSSSAGAGMLPSVPSSQQAGQGAMSYLEVAQITLPVLILRCDNIIREYAIEENEKGTYMETHKKDLILCIFEVLQELSLSWELIEGIIQNWPALQNLVAISRQGIYKDEDSQNQNQSKKQRVHLLMLYDALCRCITSNDRSVRETVMGLLMGAGEQLGLIVGGNKEGDSEETSGLQGQTDKNWFPLLS